MPAKKQIIKSIIALTVSLAIACVIAFVFILESKDLIFSFAVNMQNQTEKIEPFPISVNPETKTIVENNTVDFYYQNSLASAPNSSNNWWNKVAAFFADETWYQNLASPVSRIVVIWPGERKEEIAKNIGDILHWTKQDRIDFQEIIDTSEPAMNEGKYFPGQYVAHRGATPREVKLLIEKEFTEEILKRYPPEISAQVPLNDALIIASLLEREASDFNNMREISGVIWNRLFIDMPLQLDATLQYIKGGNPYEPKWWPAVNPKTSLLSPITTPTKTQDFPDPDRKPFCRCCFSRSESDRD